MEEEKKEWSNYFKIGLTVFLTFVCCILFFFLLWRFKGFSDLWGKVMSAAEPIIIGLILAYLLNPVMKFVERPIYKYLAKKKVKDSKAKKIARVVGVIASVVFVVLTIALLIAAIVPSVIASVSSLVDTMPSNVTSFVRHIQEGKFGDSEAALILSDIFTKGTEYIEKWAKTELVPQAQNYITQITSGVISVVRAVMNFIIGIIVMVYVMSIQETLIGQSKKIIYAIFKPKRGNIIIEVVGKANDIFGGFISGKILDSGIIGLICYLGCCILQIPNAILVAVIVGVTNIIPVFGPFIGAIPSLLLVVIQSPWHALYLLIFIIVLQQVDGNIIGPKILGESTGLSSFWVMFAILVFGGLFGFAGMLLGVPIFAVIYYLVRRIVNYALRRRDLSEDTLDYIEATSVDVVTNEIKYSQEKEKTLKKKRKKVEEKKDPQDEDKDVG